MEDRKILEYAQDLKDDLKYSLENEEEQVIREKDIKTIEWLIEQAKRAEMYKSSLMYIGSKHEPPASLHANSVLFDADQRFERIDKKG